MSNFEVLLGMGRNMRLGVRRLIHTPGFVAIAIISLGLAIGANVGVFSIIRQSILRPMPVQSPDELVSIFMTDTISPGRLEISRLNYLDLKERSKNAFSDIAAYLYLPVLVDQGSNPQRTVGALVTGNYFQMLGVSPTLGRVFRPDEDVTPGASPNIILSNEFWISQFGGDTGIVGRTIFLNKHAFVVTGVLPPGFNGTEIGPDINVWMPLNMYAQADPVPDWYDARRALSLSVVGRLRNGITPAQAQTVLSSAGSELAQLYPIDNRHRSFGLLPLLTARLNVGGTANMPQTLRILNIIIAMILLIGCSNVALQLLVRHTRRSRTMAIQKVVGATQRILVVEWMTEVLLLCLGGAVLGLLLAFLCLRLGIGLIPVATSAGADVDLNYRAIELALLLALLSTVICGIIPLVFSRKVNLVESLKQQTSTWNVHGTFPGIRKVLIALEIVFCMVPLVNAGLLIRSLNNAWLIDPGFRSDHILIMNLDLGLLGYDDPHMKNFYTEVIPKVEAIQGIKRAVVVRYPPLAQGMRRTVFIEGRDEGGSQNGQLVRTNVVGLNYFDMMGIRIIDGRDFQETDTENTTNVIVINDQMAQMFWPGQSAVGKRLKLFGETGYRQVVGVARNAKVDSITENTVPYIYLPLRQFLPSSASLFILTSGDPGAYASTVQGSLSSMDSSLRAFNVRSMSKQIENSLAGMTRILYLLTALGVLGLLLAATGIYGVISQMIADKNREIGIRMALGSSRLNIASMLLREAMTPVFIGALLGAIVSWWMSGILRSSLFGVSPEDPITYAFTIFLLFLTSLLACAVPTWGATRINPVSMIRSE